MEEEKFKWSELPQFLKSKIFLHTLVRLLLFFLILWLINIFILSFYTNHGQKLTTPNYVGAKVEKAEKHALSKSYELVVTDSIHIIGKAGGMVISQIPIAGSKVKRGRKIYVTITRYNADVVMSETLPVLYGKKLEHKQQELYNSYELKSGILDYKFDPGPSGHILEVYYKGKLIANAKERISGISISKGDTLGFILSKSEGGEIELPNFVCKTLSEAKFILAASKLEIGKLIKSEDVTSEDDAFISAQKPVYGSGIKIKMGESVDFELTAEKPDGCN